MKTFAILGCGMIAAFHAEAIGNIDGAVLKGVADVKFESAERFARERNIVAYESYDKLLEDEEIDAVCICTPNGFHAEGAIKALDAKKHVVLEKPMAITTESADDIIEACRRNESCLTVISQLRLSEDIQKAKRLLDEGKFGRILSADLYMKYWRDPSYYQHSNWKGTYEIDGGGALMNQGIHGVDILQYLVGTPTVVSAISKTLVHSINAEDIIAATVEFESGAIGVIQASTCLNPGFERKIEIIGTDGYIIIVENKIEELVLNGKKVEDVTETNIAKSNSSADPSALPVELHERQIQNFINAIDKKEKLIIDAVEGKKAVKIICDIYNKAKKENQ